MHLAQRVAGVVFAGRGSGGEDEDRQGQEWAQVEAVRTESSLLSLLWNSQELGVVHIDKPALDGGPARRRKQSGGCTRLAAGEASSSGAVRGSIEITDGSVDVVDERQTHDRAARIDRRDGATARRLTRLRVLSHLDWLPAHGRVPIGRLCGPHAVAARRDRRRSGQLSTRIQGMGLSCVQAPCRGVWVRTCRPTAC